MASSPTSFRATNKKKEKKKCELIGYEALPEWLKDNEFIHGYYRCEWPMKETILSVFSVHNETLNVWSHLMGFLLFLCLTVLTAAVIPRDGSGSSDRFDDASSVRSYWGDLMAVANVTGALRHEAACSLLLTPAAAELCGDEEKIPTSCPTNASSSLPHSQAMIQEASGGPQRAAAADVVSITADPNPITRWPLFAYLGGAMACLLTSSVCHLFLCHSERAAYLTLRLDYAGIAALIVTSFYPVVYYSFLCHPALRTLYIISITLLGVAAAAASLAPAFQAPALRPLRAALFASMGASGLVPVAHKLVLYGRRREEAVVTAGYEALMGALYGLGAVVYAARVPERWFPGRFDLVGHSHQLFHLFVVAGAYAHYRGGVEYLRWRDADKC